MLKFRKALVNTKYSSRIKKMVDLKFQAKTLLIHMKINKTYFMRIKLISLGGMGGEGSGQIDFKFQSRTVNESGNKTA